VEQKVCLTLVTCLGTLRNAHFAVSIVAGAIRTDVALEEEPTAARFAHAAIAIALRAVIDRASVQLARVCHRIEEVASIASVTTVDPCELANAAIVNLACHVFALKTLGAPIEAAWADAALAGLLREQDKVSFANAANIGAL